MSTIDVVDSVRHSQETVKKPWLGPGSDFVEEEEVPVAMSLSGAAHLPEINKYLNEQIRFQYQNCSFKLLAVPTMISLFFFHYEHLEHEMIEMRKRVGQTLAPKDFKPKPDEEHWGSYTLDHSMFNTSLSSVSNNRVSVVHQPARVGAMFTGKLLELAKKFVMKESIGSYVSDIRHLMYVDEFPNRAPDVLKNGEWNVFAGTTVMIGSIPHVMALRWQNNQFEKDFFSLFETFAKDIQFVMIRK